eukprot:CAMPEP_0172626426 /NCGR_PEP_ID=MMETSP1068-20121228/150229_1 /TAXON_ID=35684 /ORGANISM="Pseudopedinella elastica, Strain CCMP716" /LENGTH=99 /DNA_ID=CAMNT_0013436035 /DNA_START=462 /DNA_END=761 /DNA_ORIENTATION=+
MGSMTARESTESASRFDLSSNTGSFASSLTMFSALFQSDPSNCVYFTGAMSSTQSRSTRLGASMAIAMATFPPIECPTSTAFSHPKVSMSLRTSAAIAA